MSWDYVSKSCRQFLSLITTHAGFGAIAENRAPLHWCTASPSSQSDRISLQSSQTRRMKRHPYRSICGVLHHTRQLQDPWDQVVCGVPRPLDRRQCQLEQGDHSALRCCSQFHCLQRNHCSICCLRGFEIRILRRRLVLQS